MNQIALSDEFLKKAVEIAHEKWLNTFPEPENCEHDFPEGFYEKILWEAKKHDRIKTVMRRVAAAFIAILISGAILLAANPTARAIVRKWFLEAFENHVVYRFKDDSELTELPNYELSYIPEGFNEVNRFVESNRVITVYMNVNTEQILTFEYNLIRKDNLTDFYSPESPNKERVEVNGFTADFYTATNDSSTSNLIWFNEQSVMFTINSDLDKSVILHIAEGVILENSKS